MYDSRSKVVTRLEVKMNPEELKQMIETLSFKEKIELEGIPNLDLYMDQVITLFEDKLKHNKRYEADKLLTKTMINNYIKDKLLMPAVKKKYTKEHMLLMILLYNLKQILTIGDIKSLFGTIIQEDSVNTELLIRIYEMYLEAKENYASAFEIEAVQINEYVNQEISQFAADNEEIYDEKISSMLEVVLLIEKANYYKRLAEKIIDEKISSK